MWPAPPLPAPAAPPPKKEAEAKKELTPEEIYADTLKSALTTSECVLDLVSVCCSFGGSLGGGSQAGSHTSGGVRRHAQVGRHHQ